IYPASGDAGTVKPMGRDLFRTQSRFSSAALGASAKAQQYIAEGHRWVVDLDLEKFFDRVNHDKLMAAIARRVKDKRMLRLIRAFLESGVMENGLVSPVEEGTPQGGPLSPLLSNLVLDELHPASAQAQGERDEERGGTTAGAEVSGL